MYDREISPEKDEQMIRAQNGQLNELKHIAEKLREEVRGLCIHILIYVYMNVFICICILIYVYMNIFICICLHYCKI
jgi:hypothetical protein